MLLRIAVGQTNRIAIGETGVAVLGFLGVTLGAANRVIKKFMERTIFLYQMMTLRIFWIVMLL